jgi:hypothetical protein
VERRRPLDLDLGPDAYRYEVAVMAITDTLKSLFRRRPPTEEEIARAAEKAIEKEQIRQDRAASEGRGVVPPEVPPW